MQDFIAAAKALSDPHRVRSLMALRSGELCLCQLIELLRLAPSTVSKHLTILQQAGLVESRKDGRWTYYRLPRRPAPAIRSIIRWARTGLANAPQVVADAKALVRLRQVDVIQLSHCYQR